MKKAIETDRRMAGEDHAVLTMTGGGGGYRRKPCEQCPWRVDQTGAFPAEAFRHSARTACDMASETFACHMAPKEHPSLCAGFLLRNADNNLAVRLKAIKGEIDRDKIGNPEGVELFGSYREMAIANGVPADDPAIAQCRGNDE